MTTTGWSTFATFVCEKCADDFEDYDFSTEPHVCYDCRFVDAPYVCPGCHAVGERCAPGCVDDALRRETEDLLDYGEAAG